MPEVEDVCGPRFYTKRQHGSDHRPLEQKRKHGSCFHPRASHVSRSDSSTWFEHQRSRVKLPFPRDTQASSFFPSARSAADRTESRWMIVPARTPTSQVPQLPARHPNGTSMPACSRQSSRCSVGPTWTVLPERLQTASKGASSLLGPAPKRST